MFDREAVLAEEFPVDVPAASPLHAEKRERFLARVEVSSDPGGCWRWTGGRRRRSKAQGGVLSYGAFCIRKGRSVLAHRFSRELATGDRVPADREVCHECDNVACVRPAHLHIGTHAENMAEAVARQRRRNKLSENDVRAILGLVGTMSQAAIAARFAVSQAQVHNVVQGKTWRHVPRVLVRARHALTKQVQRRIVGQTVDPAP